LLACSQRYKVVPNINATIDYLHTSKQINGTPHAPYRDIKLSNMMSDDEFDAKLGDFGLVRPVSTMVGSSGYR
jgi:serine/threonine protein kinase